MKRLCYVLLLSLVAAGLSTATEPEIILPGPGGSPGDYDRDVLWLDNPDFDFNSVSSEVIGEYGVETEAANDLMFEAPATIRKITWWGTYWNGWEGEVTGAGFNLRFYNDDGCLPEPSPMVEYLLPGDVCCETWVHGSGSSVKFVYEYCLEYSLPAGLFWFSAQMADHTFPPQWGRLGTGVIQMCEGVFRSVYYSFPEWVAVSESIGCECEASQMFEDECEEPTAVERASWGKVKGLYRQ